MEKTQSVFLREENINVDQKLVAADSKPVFFFIYSKENPNIPEFIETTGRTLKDKAIFIKSLYGTLVLGTYAKGEVDKHFRLPALMCMKSM